MIYLDNAATTWPKPPVVIRAMASFLESVGANPGRSGHRLSVAAARILLETREAVAALVNAPDPLRVVFCANATDALNAALLGLLRPGDHVVTSAVEHNSVMRPLRALESRGVSLSIVSCPPDGAVDAGLFEHAIRRETRMIVLGHASNVTGGVAPIAAVGTIARRHNALFLVDAAQTAGILPIDVQIDKVDLLAFTGHKSLYGPTGTGGLVVGPRVDERQIAPLRFGGTGSASEMETQPVFLPDRLESGTQNAVGLAGLLAGIRWLTERGMEAVCAHEHDLVVRLVGGLTEMPGVTVYGPQNMASRSSVVSFNIAGMEPSEAGQRLDEEFGILCRVGLHCAPAAHKTLGTFPRGAVRFGMGAFNTSTEIDAALSAVAVLARETANR